MITLDHAKFRGGLELKSVSVYLLFVCLELLTLFASFTSSALAEVYSCAGVYSSKPCEDDSIQPLEIEGFSKMKTIRPHKTESATTLGTERRIDTHRLPIEIFTEVSDVSGSSLRREVRVTVTGRGPVLLENAIEWGRSCRESRIERFPSREINLPSCGGSEIYVFSYNIPAKAMKSAWRITARYVDGWYGCLDLRGCCSWHKGVSEPTCESGKVICGDRNESPTCTCETSLTRNIHTPSPTYKEGYVEFGPKLPSDDYVLNFSGVSEDMIDTFLDALNSCQEAQLSAGKCKMTAKAGKVKNSCRL